MTLDQQIVLPLSKTEAMKLIELIELADGGEPDLPQADDPGHLRRSPAPTDAAGRAGAEVEGPLMPKVRPEKTYSQESVENKMFLDDAIATFFSWLRDEKNAKATVGLALLKEMGEDASKRELIDMFNEGELAITKIGEDIGWVWFDEDKKQYLPFGPILYAVRPAYLRN